MIVTSMYTLPLKIDSESMKLKSCLIKVIEGLSILCLKSCTQTLLTMESVVLNGLNIIRGEIHAILTLMRGNSRWAYKGITRSTSASNLSNSDKIMLPITSGSLSFAADDMPLAHSFLVLNEYLDGVYDLHDVDMDVYLSPFRDVVVSDQANGPLTCAALASLVKFASFGFISSHFPHAKEGVALLADCVVHCIFEATDWESDELILMKLLELSMLTYKCDASRLLLVSSALSIYNTCISLQAHYQAKIMQFEAEVALRHLTMTVFSRAHISASAKNHLESESMYESTDSLSSMVKDLSLEELESSGKQFLVRDPEGIPFILGKIMSILSGLIDVQVQTPQNVLFALSLINLAIEAGGPSISSIPVLVDILRNNVCRNLLKACFTENLEIFSLVLRVAFNLFTAIKDHVKIQLEVFLSSVHLKILGSNPGSVSSGREELALESLLEFCREPSLLQDIYTNYDCDLQSTNLFDSIVSILCRKSLPDSLKILTSTNNTLSEIDALNNIPDAKLEVMLKRSIKSSSIINVLALGGLSSILQSISSRCDAFSHELVQSTSFNRQDSISSDINDESLFTQTKGEDDILFIARLRTAEILRGRKLRKENIRLAAEKFNINPFKEEWLKMASDAGVLIKLDVVPEIEASVKNSLLEMSLDPKSVATFLRYTPGISKTQVGQYIGKGPADLYPYHAAVLKEYTETFDFSGENCTFDVALRLFLGHFRLPGEAQCIDRIMEAFAGKLFRALGPDKPFKTADSAFILAFSTIMLNTDLHNPGIPVNKKMTKEQFVKNNRGINDGVDLPRQYLEGLYDELKTSQIKIDEESQSSGRFVIADLDYSIPAEWDKYLSSRRETNETASFTPSVTARHEAKYASESAGSYRCNSQNKSGARMLVLPIMHERDMFVYMGNQTFESLLLTWTYVNNDKVMSRLVKATCDYLKICGSLKLKEMIGRAVNILSKRAMLLLEFERQTVDDLNNENAEGSLPLHDKEILKQNIEIVLKSEWENFQSPKSRSFMRTLIVPSELVSPVNLNQREVSISWIGSSKIRGEILLKILFHFFQVSRHLIPHDSWSSIVDIIMYSRRHGVLPSCLSTVRSHYQNLVSKTNMVITLPLSSYGYKCMEAFMPSKKKTLSKSTSTKNVSTIERRDSANLRQSTSLWNLLWLDSTVAEYDVPSTNSKVSPVPANHQPPQSHSEQIKNLHELVALLSKFSSHVSSNSTRPSNRSDYKPSRDYFDGNIIDLSSNSDEEIVPSGLGFDKNYDLVRLVLSESKLENLFFVQDLLYEGIAVISIFDAFMKALTDILNLIVSVQNHSTALKLQVDASLLLEWLCSMIYSNPALVPCLWHKLHRSILSMVFESELSKIVTRAPYFLERCVVLILHLSGKYLTSAVSASEAKVEVEKEPDEGAIAFEKDSILAQDDMVWQSIKLLLKLPFNEVPELGGFVGAGVLSLIRVAPRPIVFSTADRWSTVLGLLSSSTISSVGRVFVWEALNDIIDNNHIWIENYEPLHDLVLLFVYGGFRNRQDLKDVDVKSNRAIDLTSPWLPQALMHLLKLSLSVVMATTINTDNIMTISLPQWPSGGECISPESCDERSRLIYSASDEDSFDRERPSTSSLCYYATHLALRPVTLKSEEQVETIWLDTCSVISSLVSGPKEVSARSVFCLKVLIEAGKDSALPPRIWSSLVIGLISRLPLTLHARTQFSEHTLTALSITTSDMNSSENTVCLQCCTLIFDLLVNHVRELQQFTDFTSIWLQFIRCLTSNLSILGDRADTIRTKMMDMIVTSLRLLVSAINIRRLKFQKAVIQTEVSTPLTPSSSSQESIPPAPDGLFQFVTELLGFSGSPAPDSGKMSSSPVKSLESVKPPPTPGYSGIPELTSKAMDLTNNPNSKFSTPMKPTSLAVSSAKKPSVGAISPLPPTYVVQSDSKVCDTATMISDSPAINSESAMAIAIDSDQTLLTQTWKTITANYIELPDQLRQDYPSLMDELEKLIPPADDTVCVAK